MIPDQVYARLAEVARAHLSDEAPGPPGDTVGCYRLVARIGKGAAGEVFRAEDPEGHPVALKVLDRRWRGERYARELELLERAAGQDGVVALLDAGWSSRGPYLVLELAEGGSLRARLERGPLPWREAVLLGARVAKTLGALHRDGIIHRDLKPENILLRQDGTPLVSDFGLAKDLAARDGELTQAGLAIGTLGYMAPELVIGARERLGPWTDVYALGAVLFEMIAGRVPFARRTLGDAMHASLTEQAPALPGVPAPLNALLKRALARDERERFQDGAAMALALERTTTENR